MKTKKALKLKYVKGTSKSNSKRIFYGCCTTGNSELNFEQDENILDDLLQKILKSIYKAKT